MTDEEFELDWFDEDTTALYRNTKQLWNQLRNAPGQTETTRNIQTIFRSARPDLNRAIDAHNMVQFKGFLNQLNSNLEGPESELKAQAASNVATNAATAFISELRELYNALQL